MILSRYIRALSSFTIYVFTNVHLALISLMEIFFPHTRFPLDTHFTYLQNLPFTKYATLAIAAAGLVNLKFQKFWLLMFSTLFLCFWFAYITFGVGLTASNNNHTPLLYVVGLAVETLALLYLAARVNKDKQIPI